MFSPCGRYRVHFVTNGESELCVDVLRHDIPHAPQQQPHFVAVLHEPQILELTTAAGVRKTFKGFSEMMFNALIGRASCVRFFVESCAEMKQRIAADVRRRQQQRHGVQAAGANASGEEADETINLSVGSDLAEEMTVQRFLTIDYDVDFTRAVFPILLEPSAAAVSTLKPGRCVDNRGASCTSARLNDAHSSTAGGEPVEAAETIEALTRENARLQEENKVLIQLSKERMLEMQQLCEDFESRVLAGTEVERLRAKNAELRVRLQEAEEARAAAERSLEAERAARRRQRSGSKPNSESRPRPSSASERGATAKGSSPNPYLRSLSKASTESMRRRAPSVTDSTRSSSRRRCAEHPAASSAASPMSAARAQASLRQPLVSPTPLSTRVRRSRSRTGNRFDTPPPHSSSVPVRQRSSGRSSYNTGGGDSPAPRGRSGNRVYDEYPLVGKVRGSNRVGGRGESVDGGGGYGSDCASSSRASSVHSRGASSTASHERLFRASTVASRSKQMLHAAVTDTPPRRAVFR